MMNYNRFKTETVYMWDDENQLYVKSIPGKGYLARSPGGEEYEIPFDSDTVVRAIHSEKEVTEKMYLSGKKPVL